MTTLVPSERQYDDDIDGLRAHVTGLESVLGERRTEAVRTRAALDAFRIRYRQEVGLLHEQLDELEIALAEAELGEISKRLDEAGYTAGARSAPPIEPAPKLTSDAVRRLFRDVAKMIHPDLAEDEATRLKRYALMIEANRAYAVGDEEQLRAIREAWERSPESVQGTGEEAMRLRLVRRIDQIEDELNALAAELGVMQGTSIWSLKRMVDEEAAKGNDLVKDMVRRLKRDILVATNRLEALRGPG